MADTSVSLAQQPSVQAHAHYVRNSAYKAREVLNLIRGKSCADASDILAFSSRAIAKKINKVLNSAVANAEHNSGLDADELYVSGCYANEGPTLKRWRPRAQGRASPIFKRTCHITVIVSRYDEERLDNMRERGLTRTPRATSESRKRRVARSRKVQETAQAPEVAAVAATTDSRVATGDAKAEQANADAGVATDAIADETGISEDSETSNYTADASVTNDLNNVDGNSTDTDNADSRADGDNQDESDSSGQEPDDSSAEKTV